MKIGILESGEVSPDLRARHGDYPAMFEALLRAADPGLAFTTVRVVAGETPESPPRPTPGSSPARATASTTTCPGSRRSRPSFGTASPPGCR